MPAHLCRPRDAERDVMSKVMSCIGTFTLGWSGCLRKLGVSVPGGSWVAQHKAKCWSTAVWTVCSLMLRTCAPMWSGGLWPEEERWNNLDESPEESNRKHLMRT